MMKKVVFFADVNNGLFTVANALSKSSDIKVEFLPDLNLQQHFRISDILPSNNFNVDEFISYNNYNYNYNSNFGCQFEYSSLDNLSKVLKNSYEKGDIIVGSDYAPLIAKSLGLQLTYFVATGADLISRTRFNFNLFIREGFKSIISKKYISYTRSLLFHRAGIKESKLLTHSRGYLALAPKPFNSMKYRNVIYPLPISPDYYPLDDAQNADKLLVEAMFKKLRQKHNYIISMVSKIDKIKGSFIFLKGFYEYVNNFNNKALLLIPNRGNFNDVFSKSIHLRKLLKSGNIYIFPPMSQRSIYYLSALSDASFGINYGDFSKHDWNVTIMQAIQGLSPLITYCPWKHLLGESKFKLYPHYQAKVSSQVLSGLIYFSDNANRDNEKTKLKNYISYIYKAGLEDWIELIKET